MEIEGSPTRRALPREAEDQARAEAQQKVALLETELSQAQRQARESQQVNRQLEVELAQAQRLFQDAQKNARQMELQLARRRGTPSRCPWHIARKTCN